MTPRVQILMRMKALLDAADLAGMSGVANIKVRHTRNRWANPEEKPCISIRMVSDEPRGQEGSYHTDQEALKELAVDLQVDAELQTEDSDLDPTGLERLGQIANAAVKVLKDPDALTVDGEGFYQRLVDDVIDEGVQPDDENEADEARFIHRIIVLYRTAIEDPNLLLAAEENVI